MLVSATLIITYYVAECAVFFGCQQFSFCTFLVFRIICVLHDTAFAITFCFFDWYAWIYTVLGIMMVVFLFFSVFLNIAIMVLYSRLPKIGNCCPAVQSQPQQHTDQFTNIGAGK